MKSGKSIVELAQEIQRQQNSKRDFIVDTSRLELSSIEDTSVLAVPVNGHSDNFPVRDTAHTQIAQRLQIPQVYYDRIRKEHPALLDQNVNTLFRANPEARMVRTLDGQTRAFLSNRYRRIDNSDLLEVALPSIMEMGADVEIAVCEVTERRLYIKVLNHRLRSEVTKGDVVEAGFLISNSEIGAGAVSVMPLIHRLVCLNGAIAADYGTKKHHVGRIIEAEDGSSEIWGDDTLEADDRALMLKVRDSLKVATEEAKFALAVNKMRSATEIRIKDPIKTVELAAKSYGFSQTERGSILEHLVNGGSLTSYGLMQAVTLTAQGVESFDRSVELERIGFSLLSAPLTQLALTSNNN